MHRKLGVKQLIGMGGFKNQREVFKWEGETLELDRTSYEWGTLYEIEVETVSLWCASLTKAAFIEVSMEKRFAECEMMQVFAYSLVH